MDKTHRILDLYAKFINGEIVNKYQAANIYGVNEKSIQRDIDDIRSFIEKENIVTGTIIYDRIEKGYRLENCPPNFLTKGEILAVCKILLDSRAFTKKEITIRATNRYIIPMFEKWNGRFRNASKSTSKGFITYNKPT